MHTLYVTLCKKMWFPYTIVNVTGSAKTILMGIKLKHTCHQFSVFTSVNKSLKELGLAKIRHSAFTLVDF